ncbi:YcnI family protein [Alicyclobacillus dauci]|uniref:DUF1775 domain-containing protein n=1 Tax=Alicyclobacillus dauci TaxID=1475485 RepID=A0ABY6Z130_9BACL|nr:DUF1775 domain-containing protein [Alicyclobacillus dauci]WAH36429.1 DUF1775 domain-containing protein [Alicyclobacillus dauci]
MIRSLIGVGSGLATLSVTATAFAHVIVNPAQSTVGAWQEYTMRVPCEKTDPTMKVVLKIPNGVQFQQYEPVAGWTVQAQKTGQDEVVTWRTIGSGIQPGQFMEFPFIATNPKQPASLDWNAYQYYKDGTIVEWTGAPGSATPHSITQVLTSNTQPTPTSSSGNAAENTSTASFSLGWTTADTWVLTVSIVAILLSGVSIAFSLRGNKKQ